MANMRGRRNYPETGRLAQIERDIVAMRERFREARNDRAYQPGLPIFVDGVLPPGAFIEPRAFQQTQPETATWQVIEGSVAFDEPDDEVLGYRFKCTACQSACIIESEDEAELPLYCAWSGEDVTWELERTQDDKNDNWDTGDTSYEYPEWAGEPPFDTGDE